MDATSAINALLRQKQKGLELASDTSADETARRGWYSTTRAVLGAAFGSESSNIGAVLSAGPYRNRMYFEGTPDSVIEANERENLRSSAAMLDSCIEQLQLLAPAGLLNRGADESTLQTEIGTSVFIVHGKDEGRKEAVARFVSTLGLNPIILHEQPNQGRTLIEKFEAHADVSFAVVILTGDDSCGSTPAVPRARQNVVFELGYFVGRLGRKRVCTLYQEGVEIPSDFNGIVYVLLDAAGAWRTLLARELKAAGFHIDMNRAL